MNNADTAVSQSQQHNPMISEVYEVTTELGKSLADLDHISSVAKSKHRSGESNTKGREEVVMNSDLMNEKSGILGQFTPMG